MIRKYGDPDSSVPYSDFLDAALYEKIPWRNLENNALSSLEGGVATPSPSR
jgi:hypothetical protein